MDSLNSKEGREIFFSFLCVHFFECNSMLLPPINRTQNNMKKLRFLEIMKEHYGKKKGMNTMAHKLNRKKFSTYLAQDVIQAIRRLAACKDVSMNVVIEAALRKCIPTKYYKEE